ncbi:MAG: hypothetical protein ACK5Z5_06275 [Neisseriaceae bacterium]
MIVKIEGIVEFDLSKVETIEFTKRLGRYCMDFQWLDSVIEDGGNITLVLNSIPIFFEDRNSRKNAYLKIMYAKSKGIRIFESTRYDLAIASDNISLKHKSPQLQK